MIISTVQIISKQGIWLTSALITPSFNTYFLVLGLLAIFLAGLFVWNKLRKINLNFSIDEDMYQDIVEQLNYRATELDVMDYRMSESE